MEWFKYFIKTIKNNYANFNGRVSRKELLIYIAIYTIIVFALMILTGILFAIWSVLGIICYITLFLFILGTMIPSLALQVRRMHDIGRTGWHVFVPVMSLIWALKEGEVHDNQYGPAPEAFKMPSAE